MAPEYATRGYLTEKADVFSYGVVALEIVCGRRNHDKKLGPGQVFLLDWVWSLYESNRDFELVDPKLNKEYNREEVKRIIKVSLLCTQASPELRPTMSRVVAMLSRDAEVPLVISRSKYLTDAQFNYVTASASSPHFDTSTSHSAVSTDTSTIKTPAAETPRSVVGRLQDGR
ncbi:hypothetical protein M569_17342 [Genlisea aurea]|uniref:Protein kinase domain-containing protein n=1 Tax=Genlisea aurea TaxID=192259 RepID=S8BSD3_9LAMI|nr:hypothetical protein M569_17342 [Genlisea aurea]